jgi:hypothetical protein
VAVGAILAPNLHTAPDAMEWLQGGFSQVQLWLNYLAFLPLPVLSGIALNLVLGLLPVPDILQTIGTTL